MPTAIMIDVGFFIKRYRTLFGDQNSPQKVAQDLHELCRKHLFQCHNSFSDLYRIFVYDCPPLGKRIHHPITHRSIDLSKTAEFIFRTELHRELKKLRKVALRLGRLTEQGAWTIKSEKIKLLLSGNVLIKDLVDADLIYDVRQKGVDMKIGLDIASLAFKKLVHQIILIAGDSDFVPAAKLTRREGIDFILDPMWCPISPDLHEHIDGLRSSCPKPKSYKAHVENPELFLQAPCNNQKKIP